MLTNTDLKELDEARSILGNAMVHTAGADEKTVSRWFKDGNNIIAPGRVHVASDVDADSMQFMVLSNPNTVRYLVRMMNLVYEGENVSPEIEETFMYLAREIIYVNYSNNFENQER